jgi:hypothetical protein
VNVEPREITQETVRAICSLAVASEQDEFVRTQPDGREHGGEVLIRPELEPRSAAAAAVRSA